MNVAQITPLILTYNEKANLARSLDRLDWATQVLVVDSCSTDETVQTANASGNVRVVQRAFDDHTSQWNFGLSLITTEWVLALDADYVLTPEFVREIKSIEVNPSLVALFANFRYCIQGVPLRGSLYPARAVLFRKDQCSYEQDGHTQTLRINGETAYLSSFIDHDDRKPLECWLQAQTRYAKLEAAKLTESRTSDLLLRDRLRKMLMGPILVFFYTMVVKRLGLEGWRGWFYIFQRTYAELLISLYLIDSKIPRR